MLRTFSNDVQVVSVDTEGRNVIVLFQKSDYQITKVPLCAG